jgi:cob(I)alamin adenosyltransferase
VTPHGNAARNREKGGSADMLKIYTRRGDAGTTSLRGGARVEKSAPTVELLGTLDEAQAALGVARAECVDPRVAAAPASGPSSHLTEVAQLLEAVERDLWTVMGEVARNDDVVDEAAADAAPSRALHETMVRHLEEEIDRLGAGVELAPAFAVPGENRLSASIDLARTIVRRAERVAVTVVAPGSITLAYLNRLSDFCWMLARSVETERRTTHRDTPARRHDEI